MKKQPTHCCELMDQFLVDPKVPLGYYPICRKYGLILKHSPAIQLIYYCPWCGAKLPKSLGDEFYDILEREYNMSPGFDIQSDPNIPQEFKSDEWWRKRGL